MASEKCKGQIDSLRRAEERTVVGVDIGGTFTDFVVLRGGRLEVHKVPSTPSDPSAAFLAGLEELGIGAGAWYVHGSTVATNAVLERRGARAALLTTEGFRDLLELGRQTRLDLYSFMPRKHVPLIPRELCFEVPERVDRDGNVLVPLDAGAVDQALDAVAAAGAESLAVVFLFSFVLPEHERLVGKRAAARGLSVSLSSEILPEYREYERASTTAANAYVAPLMDRYLGRLAERLEERGCRRLQIMQSNGGVISAETARREAVRTILSGPAGGVVGAWKVASAAGFERILTLDMGGTSTDVALVDGEPALSTEGMIAHLPIRVPMLDIHTVGAGGGSLARVEPGGSLRVGPQSAGADPGPAAYGKGDQPTVTDANLLLGRLWPGAFLGGRMALDTGRSRAALVPVARALGLSVDAAAAGIVRVANVQMARALRRVSVERGHDPREFCLVAFGGGGPLHACDLAEELGIPTVLVPRFPGALSALGMLLSDLQKEYSRTVMLPVDATGGLRELEAVFEELEARAREEMRAEGVATAELRLARRLDTRYRGQSYEIGIPVERLEPEVIAAAFHTAHRKQYGHASEGAPCEIVNARLRATGPAAMELGSANSDFRVDGDAWLGEAPGGVPMYAREGLAEDAEVAGPALIVQGDATTWLPVGWSARVDSGYNLVVTR